MREGQQVKNYMNSATPLIEHTLSLTEALNLMRVERIRHLPVYKNGKLLGVLSRRDLNFILEFSGLDLAAVTVGEACTLTPYMAHPAMPVEAVVKDMNENQHRCALVVEGDQLLGVFTELDAYRAVSDLLRPYLNNEN